MLGGEGSLAMRRAEPETLYSHTSAANAVTFTVEAGEVFEVETGPCCGRAGNSSICVRR